MQKMLDICAEKFEKMGLKFNVANCVAAIVGKCYASFKNLLLYDRVLPRRKGLCYLSVLVYMLCYLSVLVHMLCYLSVLVYMLCYLSVLVYMLCYLSSIHVMLFKCISIHVMLFKYCI